ncbi:hypothetical protein ACJX0J_018482 [Zea mays]
MFELQVAVISKKIKPHNDNKQNQQGMKVHSEETSGKYQDFDKEREAEGRGKTVALFFFFFFFFFKKNNFVQMNTQVPFQLHNLEPGELLAQFMRRELLAQFCFQLSNYLRAVVMRKGNLLQIDGSDGSLYFSNAGKYPRIVQEKQLGPVQSQYTWIESNHLTDQNFS